MNIEYSVVVATYNRAALLKKCVESLLSQNISRSEYEIIIVNDGSSDETDLIINDLITSVPDPNIIYLKQQNSGPAKARNFGAASSGGKILFFTDDDCVVPNDWITTLAKEYVAHPEISGVGGWFEYNMDNYNNFLAKAYIDIERLMFAFAYPDAKRTADPKDPETRKFSKNPTGNTSNMSYLSAVFKNVGGFDEKIDFVGWVDWELKNRIMRSNHILIFLPITVQHQKPLNAAEIVLKYFNRGRGIFHFLSKYPMYYHYYYPSLSPKKFLKMSQLMLSTGAKVKYSHAASKKVLILMMAARRLITRLGWHYQEAKKVRFWES